MKEFVLFVGHGSRDIQGNAEFVEFVNKMRVLQQERNIEFSFLELAAPTIPEGIDACVRQGAARIVVIPVILLAATHVKLEIPQFLHQARQKYPQVEIVYGRNIGLHERIIDLLVTRYKEQAEKMGGVVPEETAIVLMGRGSSDADANGDLYKIARQLWERLGVNTVEVCFSGVTFPLLPEGVARALVPSVKTVIVVPYFLFTGVLIKRMQRVLKGLQRAHPEIRMAMATYFGGHPYLEEIVRSRQIEAAHGRAWMNCDFCQYSEVAALNHSHTFQQNSGTALGVES